MNNTSPKCKTCKKQFQQKIKSSGLPYKTCDDCRILNIKNKPKYTCSHNIQKYYCKDCNGTLICCHNLQKYTCKECKGTQICIHNIQKAICKDCNGNRLCSHNKQKIKCKICNQERYLVGKLSQQMYRWLKLNIKDKEKYVEDIGCTNKEFKEYINKKIQYYNTYISTDTLMTLDNLQLDHIKPICRFNLKDKDDFSKCCHYTNIQPLLKKDNFSKHSTWNTESEKIYIDKILYNKNYFEIFIPKK